MPWVNARELQNRKWLLIVSTAIGIWVSCTSWLTHTSHLDYSGVAQSVCSTEQSNLISYTVNGLAADETLQPELLPAVCALSRACSSNPTLLDRWANPCCEQRLATARLMGFGSQGKGRYSSYGLKIAMNTNPTRTGLCKPAGTCLLTRFHQYPADFASFRG